MKLKIVSKIDSFPDSLFGQYYGTYLGDQTHKIEISKESSELPDIKILKKFDYVILDFLISQKSNISGLEIEVENFILRPFAKNQSNKVNVIITGKYGII